MPSDRHAQPSAKPADGSQLAPPPQPARGAAAPSSLPSPIRCGPDQKHYSGIAPSSERIASGCTKQAQSHLQLYGILTEITHCSRRILQTSQIGHRRRARCYILDLLVIACAKWGPVLRAPLEYRGFSIGTEWPVEKFGSSEIHRCTVGFPQTIS